MNYVVVWSLNEWQRRDRTVTETITLYTKSGGTALANVKLRVGEFVVHKNVLANLSEDRRLWKVTHEPSSAGMAQCQSLEAASVIAHALAALPVKWPKKLINPKNRHRESMRVLQQLPYEVEKWMKSISEFVLYGEAA